jgi:uncharacterized protein
VPGHLAQPAARDRDRVGGRRLGTGTVECTASFEVPMSDHIELPSLGSPLFGAGGGLTPETERHWRAAAQGHLTVPRCDACGWHRWPFSYACYHCLSTDWSWAAVPGTGTVYTYTWVEAPTHLGIEPTNLVVIELDGTNGEPVRLPGWVVGTDRDSLACGMAVRVDFEPVADGIAVPFWRPAAAAAH